VGSKKSRRAAAHQGGELVTTGERDALLQRTIDEIPAEIEAYDERVAIQTQVLKRGRAAKTTADYAIEALHQPDTPRASTLSRERGYEL
jgi:hypothetical protein